MKITQPVAQTGRPAGCRGFTMVEVLVVIAVITILMGLLLIVMPQARESSRRTKCASNLKSIHLYLWQYAQAEPGMNTYPRTAYIMSTPAAPYPPVSGTGIAAPDPFGPGGPGPNDVSSVLFLLIRELDAPRAVFICPSADSASHFADPNNPALQSNFTDYNKNLCYSYANPYPDLNAVSIIPPYKLDKSASADFALMADKNPGSSGGNSHNHAGAGQNVLYNDGHVEWSPKATAGTLNDDIYHDGSGKVWGVPTSATDSVLLPADP